MDDTTLDTCPRCGHEIRFAERRFTLGYCQKRHACPEPTEPRPMPGYMGRLSRDPQDAYLLTGSRLDRYVEEHGLLRGFRETDANLRARLLEKMRNPRF